MMGRNVTTMSLALLREVLNSQPACVVVYWVREGEPMERMGIVVARSVRGTEIDLDTVKIARPREGLLCESPAPRKFCLRADDRTRAGLGDAEFFPGRNMRISDGIRRPPFNRPCPVNSRSAAHQDRRQNENRACLDS